MRSEPYRRRSSRLAGRSPHAKLRSHLEKKKGHALVVPLPPNPLPLSSPPCISFVLSACTCEERGYFSQHCHSIHTRRQLLSCRYRFLVLPCRARICFECAFACVSDPYAPPFAFARSSVSLSLYPRCIALHPCVVVIDDDAAAPPPSAPHRLGKGRRAEWNTETGSVCVRARVLCAGLCRCSAADTAPA